MEVLNYRRIVIIGMVIGVMSISASGPLFAAEAPVALEGYCPVAYHKMDKAVKGKKEFSAVYDGKTYYFVKEMARDLFKKNPSRFLPVLNGLCVVCKVGKKGMDNPGKPEIFSIYKKQLYLFAGAGSKKTFDASPEKYATFIKNYKSPVALGGYCPVAYHKMGKAVKGKKEFSAVYDGITYYFVKEMARDLFKKNPSMFLPVLKGLCVVCQVDKHGMKNLGKPEIFSVYKKQLYLFASPSSKKKFDTTPEKYAVAPKTK
ncbi:MAG: hypothetical protein JKX85_00335 [Phycisphaeraceae bacterium]|nr:hypothetical protein [Phycisphaeraceae bacterium]